MVIRNLIIIGGILGITFLSQQPWINGVNQTYFFPVIKKAEDSINNSFLGKAGSWISTKFTSEAEKRGEIAKEELSIQKNNAINNFFDSAKKFIAEKTLQTLGVKPEDLTAECKP